MSRFTIACLLALYTHIGWGLIAPMAVLMSQNMGARYNPFIPFFANMLGALFWGILLLFYTGIEPIKVWNWHWSAWVIFVSWPTASIVLPWAYRLASPNINIPNLIAGAYIAIASPILLYFLVGESLNPIKLVGIVGVFIFTLVVVFG